MAGIYRLKYKIRSPCGSRNSQKKKFFFTTVEEIEDIMHKVHVRSFYYYFAGIKLRGAQYVDCT